MDRDALIQALRAADAAGDVPAAQAIARHISTLQTPAGAPNAPALGGSPAKGAPVAVEGMLTGKESAWERARLGLANVGIGGYLGVKNLLGKLDPEEQNVLAQSNADLENSGFAGKAANLGGNVAGGIAATMLAPQVTLPSYFVRSAPYVKAALGSGAMAGVSTPASDQENILASKAKEAGKAAALGPAVLAGGQAVAKAGTGMFKATQDAIDLIRQGVVPTLQQGAESPWGRFVGGLTSGFTDVRGRQEKQLLDALTERASGGQIHAPDATAGERVAMLNSSIGNDYDQVLSKKLFPMTGKIRDEALQQADNIKKSGGRFIDQQSEARGILDNIIGSDRNAVRLRSDTLRNDYLDRIQSAIQPSNDPLVNEALLSAKNIIVTKSRNSRLTPQELQALQEIDSRYYDMMRLRDASKGAGAQETGVDIKRLADAYGKGPGADVIGAANATNESLIGPLVRTVGSTPRQDEARTLLNTGKRIAVAGAANAAIPQLAAPLYALSAAGQTSRGAKALFGQYDVQKSLKAALESPQTDEITAANFLRALRDNSSTLGAGLTPGY